MSAKENFRQVYWLDRLRERLAVWLAPWAIHDDLLAWHRAQAAPEGEAPPSDRERGN